MTWAAPRTWVAAESVTADVWRGVFGQLRANAPALTVAANDLLVGSGVAGTPLQRLPVGSAGQVLTAGASTVAWDGAPQGAVFDLTTLTDTAGTASTWVQWGTEECVVANPGVACTALAVLSGSQASGLVRVGVSFDGGNTWDYGSEPHSSLSRVSVMQAHLYAGTPSADVWARAEWYRAVAGAYDGCLLLVVFT